MQDGGCADQHEDFDDGSLFGSPPPSPGRGRSSSPLALPGGQNSVQNVGTLALPGSHLCSELPPALPPAPSINTCGSGVVRQRSQPPSYAPQAPPPRSATLSPSPAFAPSRLGSNQKRKRSSRRSTPVTERRSPPPIELPSATDPPPTHFLRNQQALLGHAGLISGVHPANLALQRHLRGKTPQNPIVIEEEDDQPSIGQRSSFTQTSLTRLPVPSSHEILSNLVKQKNLIPVVDALIRLVAGSAVPTPPAPPPPPPSASSSNCHAPSPSTASPYSISSHPSYPYPYHHYPYAYPYYYHYPYGYTYPYAASTYQQPAAPYTTGGDSQPKRRKLSNVPAGASDWDVPYPFPEGQGPPGYHQNWQRLRGEQLVEDLVGLVKSAVKKAVVQKAQEGASGPAGGHALGSVEYYRDRVLSHYRPHTRYDARSAPQTAPRPTVPPMASLMPDSPSKFASNSDEIPPSDTPPSVPPIAHFAPEPGLAAPSAGSTIPPGVDEELPDSTGARPPELEHIGETTLSTPLVPEANTTAQPSTNTPMVTNPDSLSQHTEENIDDLLSIFNDLPAGELDALLHSTDFSALVPEDFDFTSLFDAAPATQTTADALPLSHAGDLMIPETQPSDPTNTNMDTTLDLSTSAMFAIDPELLALSNPVPPPIVAPTCDDATTRPERPHVQTTNTTSSMGSGAPPTPTLVGSPLSQVDFDPPTPSWEFPFLEPEIAGNGLEAAPARAGSGGGNDPGAFMAPKDLRRHVLTKTFNSSVGVGGRGPLRGKDKGKGRAVEIEMEAEREDSPMAVDPPSMPLVASTPSRASSISGPSVQAPTPILTSHLQSPAPFNPLDVLEPLRKTLQALLPQPSRVHSLLVAPPAVMQLKPTVPTQVKDRDEILRRARLMRQQLAEEVQRAKIELWETTMEGGCLAVLAKERDKLIAESK